MICTANHPASVGMTVLTFGGISGTSELVPFLIDFHGQFE